MRRSVIAAVFLFAEILISRTGLWAQDGQRGGQSGFAGAEAATGTPSVAVASQNSPGAGASLVYRGKNGYSLVERTNLRRYVNGKYVGLTSREVRSFISPTSAPAAGGGKNAADRWYDGSFYVLEATKSNARETAGGIHDSISSIFFISPDGRLTMVQDRGYPSFRSFPAFTRQTVKPGDSWKAAAERAVDPLNKGIFTRIPMEVLYQFVGEETYKGEAVYRIKAQWQTNYGSLETKDPRGDSSLSRAAGNHKADILVIKATGVVSMILDTVDETFQYVDGTMANFKGSINLFTEFPPALDSEKLIPALRRIAQVEAEPVAEPGAGLAVAEKLAPKNNILVEKTAAGLRLSVRDIKFKPDSAELMEGEEARLDEIAAVLSLAPESQLLVEGHTAAVGNPDGEQRVSELRARRIAEELSRRGVNSKAFICRGFGAKRPIADNASDSGRAQNRRVEITILE